MTRKTRLALLPVLTFALAACGGADEPDAGDHEGPPGWRIAEAVALPCDNAGAVAVADGTAFVACGGSGAGDGALAIVDLATGGTQRVATGGAPASVAVEGETVLLGDTWDGRVFVVDRDGTVRHDADDPVVVCPAPADGWEFVSDVGFAGGVPVATCFSSDALVRFEIAAGTPGEGGVRNARILDRVGVGDGAGALHPWGETRLVTLDSLAGTASLINLGDEVGAEKARWQTGESPNDVVIRGDLAYIVNSVGNTLQVLDLAGGRTEDEIFLGDGTNPYGVAVLPDGLALVSLLLTNEVAVVDLAAGGVAGRVAMPAGEALQPARDVTPMAWPQGVAATGDGRAVVTLPNLGPDYAPAGPGWLVILEPDA